MAERAERQADIDQQRRILWLLIVLSMLGFLLIGRLAWFQLIMHTESYARRPESIPAVRGSILDANGHYLAVSTYACNVYFRPDLYDHAPTREALEERLKNTIEAITSGKELPAGYGPALASLLVDSSTGQPRPLLNAVREPLFIEGDLHRALVVFLSDILNEPRGEMDRLLRGSRDWRQTLSAGVPAPVCQALIGLNSEILVVEAGYQRVYPDGALLAHAMGFVNFDGEPQYGLEAYYDRYLRGTSGEWRGISHPSGDRLLAILGGHLPARDGYDLILTLDRSIQHEAERILRKALLASEAGSGTLIVLDARTGAVLAMANTPTYEPASFYDASLATFRNNAISAIYEPGSVIKPLTVAAALDARVIHPDTTYDDQGAIVVGDQEIRNADGKAHGVTTMTEMLAYSLNVGAAHVASALGPARFYELFKRFGFSDPTGIDLAAEERGILRVPGQDTWHMSDLGRNSFGQGMSATPLQVAVAYGALANGGVIRRPHMVAAVREPSGLTSPLERDWGRQVISPEVAAQVTDMLVEAVRLGMQPALVPGYTIAGKSGTSQVVAGGEYQQGNYIGSFVGYGPATDPRFVILVKLDGLADGQWGVREAGPAFAEMFKYLMDYYGIPPDA
jgi:cell division protein FtsI/penicillin-binding protein 2